MGEGAAVVLYSADNDGMVRLSAQDSNNALLPTASLQPNLDSTYNPLTGTGGAGGVRDSRGSAAGGEGRDEFAYSLLDNSAFVRGAGGSVAGPGRGAMDNTGVVLQGSVTGVGGTLLGTNTLLGGGRLDGGDGDKAERMDRAR